MKNIKIHIAKTEKLLDNLRRNLDLEISDCINDLVAYEIREQLLRIERKQNKFNRLKESLTNNYNNKDSLSLKKLYKSIRNN